MEMDREDWLCVCEGQENVLQSSSIRQRIMISFIVIMTIVIILW